MIKFKIHHKLYSLLGILGANVINNFSSFVITIFAARFLGPANFAKLALAMAITTNLTSILDCGTSVALVRLYNVSTDDNYKSSLIKIINKWKIGLLLLIILISYPVGQLIIQSFPIIKDTGLLVYLAIISSGLLSIWTTTRATEQSQKNFKSFQRYTLVYGFLRLMIAILFFINNKISITTIFTSLYIAPLSILISYRIISSYLSDKSDEKSYEINEFKLLRSILGYGMWVGIGGILFGILYQIPQFVLASTANASEVGFYGAGLTFLPVFLLTNDAIRTIILPDVSAIKNQEGRQLFRKRLWQISPIFFSLMLVVLIAMSCVQYLLLGKVYQDSVPVFLAMGFSTILVMFIGYSNTLIHSIGIPHVGAIVNMISAAIILMLSLLLPKTALFMSLLLGLVMIIGESLTYFTVLKIDNRNANL
ncbi:MAG: oligosaccharide flippase family protein [Scytonematopsis contorta HA4267-MV1]|nr:oligosaccharide flippase family protein [Scytonematopsis contorta HA4267-MV1]